ncbi:MAG: CBS domain-containing protein [Flavobacteriales bacterium]|jgi:CBS domain-containing protein|nr:CBS domain-containing protein [Flavobacteriales bacterium]
MLVEEVMTAHTRTVSPEQSLSDVRKIFEEENFRHLPVMGNDGLVGIITLTDLMRVTYGAHIAEADFEVNDLILETTIVEECMSKKLRTVEPGTSLAEAARIMRKYKVGCVPVVNFGYLLGLVTTTDVLSAYISLKEE